MKVVRYLNLDALLPLFASLVLVTAASFIYPKLLTANYLLQQLQIASFLGVMATGAMVVILLGHIDLSVPWTVGGAAIISTSFAGTGDPVLSAVAIPAGLLFGILVGIINGVGVSIFRIPAMVWTLAINAMLLGLAILNTGGFNPKGEASGLMVALATGTSLGLPNALLVWLALSAVFLWIYKSTAFGRYIYAIGNAEKVSYLSGINTTQIVFGAFALAGLCSALGGILLAGYANQAYQSMGDPYLLPVIAAVVIGGTSILGGSGSYLGTFFGAIFITLLTSVLSVMQIEEAWRQIIFGGFIITMLMLQNIRRQ